MAVVLVAEDEELSPNLGDASANFTPRMIFGNWLWPSRRRQLFSAASASLKIMASAVLFDRHPLDRTVRWQRGPPIADSGHVRGIETHRVRAAIR